MDSAAASSGQAPSQPRRTYQWQPAPLLPQTQAYRAAKAAAAAAQQQTAGGQAASLPAGQPQQQQQHHASIRAPTHASASAGAAAAAALPPAQQTPWRPAVPASAVAPPPPAAAPFSRAQPASSFQPAQSQTAQPAIRPATFMQAQAQASHQSLPFQRPQQPAQAPAPPSQQRAPGVQANPWKPSMAWQQQQQQQPPQQSHPWAQKGPNGFHSTGGVAGAAAQPSAAFPARAAPPGPPAPMAQGGGGFMSSARPMQPTGAAPTAAATATSAAAPMQQRPWPAAGANPWANVSRAQPPQQSAQQVQSRQAPFSSSAVGGGDMFSSRTYNNGAPAAPPVAAAPAPAAPNPWARSTPSAAVLAAAQAASLQQRAQSQHQQQQQSASTPTRQTGPPATAAGAWSGDQKNSSSASKADADFMAKFSRPGANMSPIKGGGAAASSSASSGGPASLPALTPLCQGHGLPMQYLTSRKPESAGKKFFICPLAYSAPGDKCKSFVWESDLALPGRRGFKIATRGPNGDLQQEVSLSFEVVSETHFAVTVVPPCGEISDLLRAEGGAVDEAAMSTMNAYAQANPCHFIFPLQQHDPLAHKLTERKREQPAAAQWTIEPVPVRARQALLEDLALASRETYEAAADGEENEASALVCDSLSQRPGGGATAAAAAAGASSGPGRRGDIDTDEDAPIVRRGAVGSAGSAASKKKKGAPLLQTKTQRQKDETRLTPQEEGELNIQKLPPSLRNALLPFQFDGVKYLVSKHGRGLLADEMGLGKTIQAIAVASYYNHDWPLLVICPSSLRLNWQDEIMRWLPFLNRERIFVVKNVKAGEAVLARDPIHKDVQGRDFGIIIFSIDIAASLGPQLKKRNFKCIIIDESHMIKSAKAKRTKAVLPLLKTAKRAILLSGTPALNRPEELYTQIHALQPGLFPQHRDFGMRYCAGVKAAFGNGMDFKGSSHLRELHVLLKKYLLIRREKMQVLKQLPAKRRQAVMVDVPKSACAAAFKEVNQLHGSAEEAMRDGGDGGRHKPALMKLWQTTGEAKLKAVKEYMQDLIDANIKFLVFAHHQAVLDDLDHFVRSKSTEEVPDYIRIDGSTPADTRQANVEKFQKESDCRIALLSIMAAGTGITLHAASHVVFAELIWTPAYLVQAEDRVHRIGQHFPVNIHYILGRNTLDDMLWPLISRKLESIGRAVSGEALSMNIDETTDSRTDYEQDQSRLDDFLDDDGAGAAASASAAAGGADGEGDEGTKPADDGADDEEENLFTKPAPGSATKRPRDRRTQISPSRGSASSSAAAAAAAADDDADDFSLDTLTPQANRSAGPSPTNSAGSKAPSSGARASPSVHSPGGGAAASLGKSTRPAATGFRIRKPTMITKSPAITVAAAAASTSPSVPRPSAKASSPAPAPAPASSTSAPPSPLVTPSSSQQSRSAASVAAASPKPTPPSTVLMHDNGSGNGRGDNNSSGGSARSEEPVGVEVQSTPDPTPSQEVGRSAAGGAAGQRRRKRIIVSDDDDGGDEDEEGGAADVVAVASTPFRSQFKKRKRHHLFDPEPDEDDEEYEPDADGDEPELLRDGEAEMEEVVESDADEQTRPRPMDLDADIDADGASSFPPTPSKPNSSSRARIVAPPSAPAVATVSHATNTADDDDDFLD